MDDRRVVDFNHHSKDYLDDRLTHWRRLRETPVAYSPQHGGFWVVSGHEEVGRVSRDEDVFTSELGDRDGVSCQGIAGVPRVPGIPPAGIAEADPETHRELRRALNPFLLPPAVEQTRPFIEELSGWFLDQKVASGEMDLVTELTNPVPAISTMRLVGLPLDGWEAYAELFHGSVAYPARSPERKSALAKAPEIMAGLMDELNERRRRPRDDVLSALITVRGRGGVPLDDEQIGSVLWNLIGGGLDTTTSLTSLSLYHLSRHPELKQELISEPAKLATATEEFLRYYSVNETLTRTVTRDVELGGQQLHAGDVVMLSWLSANHDESEFDRPEQVDLGRSPNRHLAFGIGAHRCIGMHLARMIYQEMMKAVLDRIPDYRVDVEATRFYEGNPLLAGIVSMPAAFSPTGPRGPAERPF